MSQYPLVPAARAPSSKRARRSALPHGSVLLLGLALGLATGVARRASAAEPELRIRVAGDVVHVEDGARPVAEYRFRESPFKPYLAQWATPSGIGILRDAPHDHLHHHAMMLGIGAGGVDFWGETPGCGRQHHRGLDDLRIASRGGMDVAELRQRLDWCREAGAPPVLREARSLAIGRCAGASLLTWTSRLDPGPGRESVELDGRHYFGLGLRFVESMDRGGEFLNADRAEGEVVRGTERLARSRWCAYRATAEGRPVTVAVFDDPGNPRHPATWFFMTAPFAYLSATLDLSRSKLVIERSEPVRLRYGAALWDGTPSREEIDALYRQWRETFAARTTGADAAGAPESAPARSDAVEVPPAWPQWRGPTGTGVSGETGLPVEWSETSGIAWKRPLPGWGNSTPAVCGDAIFVTSQEEEDLLLLRLARSDGAIAWRRKVAEGRVPRKERLSKRGDERRAQVFHETQNFASPSPVTDGRLVAVHFGSGDLAVYDFEGRLQWRRNLQAEHGKYTVWWGHANSPIIHEGLLISACMQDSLLDLPGGRSESYVVAHDLRTGRQVWKTLRMTGARAESNDAYTTPLLRSTPVGTEMVVMGGTWIDAYDPRDGRQIWCLRGLGGNRVITGPTLGEDMVYATVGMRGALFALRPGGRGELSEGDIAWRWRRGTPDSPSPVLWRDRLFIVSDRGIATCLDAKQGEAIWTERLPGDYRASPLVAEDRVYFTNMSGLTTVISAAGEFRKVAENQIDDRTTASLAVADGALYLRGRRALYCIRSDAGS